MVVSSHIESCSRSFAGDLIRKGVVSVHGSTRKSGYRVKPGDLITGCIPPPEPVDCAPEPIDIDVVYEDNDIIVVNKQSGFVVHPAPGNYTGTLVNALLHHCPDIQGIGGELRPGIVHRLDKDTTGLLVVAKNNEAHLKLSEDFKERTIHKEYLALVSGRVKNDSGIVDLPIGRHPVDRKKMSVAGRPARSAETAWRVREHLKSATLLTVVLKTGRTHQIRVHCATMHHPIIGDQLYGFKAWKSISGAALPMLPKRQMLHAFRLSFNHPVSGIPLSLEAPLPEDMASLVAHLRND